MFTGVLAYHFEGDDLKTVIFGIEEEPLDWLLGSHWGLFTQKKNYGWPILQWKTAEDLLAKLKEQQVRGFVLRSSCGMDGFVLAEQMTMTAKPER